MNSGLQFGIHHHLLYAPSVLKGRFDGCVGIDGWLSIHHFRRRISRLRADDRFEFLNAAHRIQGKTDLHCINKIYIKALVGANMAKNELQKMREEDEGLDIIITIILVAVGLVLVGILVNYAKKIVSTADSQVNQIGNTVGGLNSTVK